MKDYIICQAVKSDTEQIMDFIDSYWRKGHILAQNQILFEWQYLDDDKLNIIIAKKNEEILAILGFVKFGKLYKDGIVLALWKSKAAGSPFIGVELLQYLEDLGAKDILCNGINLKTTKAIYEFMGFEIEHLRHYYRLSDRAQYKVSYIEKKVILPCLSSAGRKLRKLKDFDEFSQTFNYSSYSSNEDIFPHKSMEYIKHRFFKHPVYIYQAIAVEQESGEVETVFFIREISCNEQKILRIVDVIGNVSGLKYISYELDRLLEDGGYEYIDLMLYGIDEETMHAAGFVLHDEKTGNIIPNYFEPYECSNIIVWISAKCKKNYILFKADGDQDRPN